MARGWESKSVEEQQSESVGALQPLKPQLTPEQIARNKVREGLLLNRSRILQQLGSANNCKHRAMLENALSDIDAKIAHLVQGEGF